MLFVGHIQSNMVYHLWFLYKSCLTKRTSLSFQPSEDIFTMWALSLYVCRPWSYIPLSVDYSTGLCQTYYPPPLILSKRFAFYCQSAMHIEWIFLVGPSRFLSGRPSLLLYSLFRISCVNSAYNHVHVVVR